MVTHHAFEQAAYRPERSQMYATEILALEVFSGLIRLGDRGLVGIPFAISGRHNTTYDPVPRHKPIAMDAIALRRS